MDTEKITYTCIGSVRGACGVTHRTLDAARRCCARDAGGIHRAYPSTYPTRAYSDREPIASDGSEIDYDENPED